VDVNNPGFFGTGPGGNLLDRYTGGIAFPSGLRALTPDLVNVSEALGYDHDTFLVPGELQLNGVYPPPTSGQSLAWTGRDLIELGLGELTSTPMTV